MTITLPATEEDERAIQAMLDHHAHLLRGLYARADELRTAVSQRRAYDAPLAALTAYLATEILPHARAEEATLYQAAAAAAPAALFVEAMLVDHGELVSRTRSLANVCDAFTALGIADAIVALFEVHVRKENELLLPALQHADGVSLSSLLQSMHQQLGDHG